MFQRAIGYMIASIAIIVCSGCGLASRFSLSRIDDQQQRLQVRAQLAQSRAEQLAAENNRLAERLDEAEKELARTVDNLKNQSMELVEKSSKADALLRFDHQRGIARLEDPIRFEDGESRLSPVEKSKLAPLADILNDDAGRDLRVMVMGHGDPHETATRNWELSATRATAVAEYLRGLGISHERLRIVGSTPSSGATSFQATPRRAEVFLVKPQAATIGWADSLQHLYR